MVFHFTVKGPNSGADANKYGVRVRNATTLQPSSISNASEDTVKGVTLVTDQAIYTYGHYNKDNKIPAAILADSLNVLSVNWNDSNSNKSKNSRIAQNTTINAAFLGGTDTTGNKEGTNGQGGSYNGGLENYPRLHEKWSNKTLLYRGSFVRDFNQIQ